MHSLECFYRLSVSGKETSKAKLTQFLRPLELERYTAVLLQTGGSMMTINGRIAKPQDIDEHLECSADPHQWTHVTDSPALVEHLFDLYFARVHPVHMLFDESNFRRGYQERLGMYCTAALVNAICAMACHLIGSTTLYIKSRDGMVRIGRAKLEAEFTAEARSHLKIETDAHMTFVQAFTVMYLVDLSSGKARNASGYLRCAGDLLSAKCSAKDKKQPLCLSALGVYALTRLVLMSWRYDASCHWFL